MGRSSHERAQLFELTWKLERDFSWGFLITEEGLEQFDLFDISENLARYEWRK